MNKLTSATVIAVVLLVIDAFANAQRWDDTRGWDWWATMALIIWVITLATRKENSNG